MSAPNHSTVSANYYRTNPFFFYYTGKHENIKHNPPLNESTKNFVV